MFDGSYLYMLILSLISLMIIMFTGTKKYLVTVLQPDMGIIVAFRIQFIRLLKKLYSLN